MLLNLTRTIAHPGLAARLVGWSPLSTLWTVADGTGGRGRVMRLTARVLDSIDRPAFDAVHERYKDAAPSPGYSKYLDAPAHIGRAAGYAVDLGLADARPLRVLDIGAGSGYFLFVCKCLGHAVHAMDLEEPRMYRELRALLGVPETVHAVQPFEPLPDTGERFDRVTGFQVMFDRAPGGGLWDADAWRFFLRDLLDRKLAPDGEIAIVLNTMYSPEQHRIHRENLAFFRSVGAAVPSDYELRFAASGLRSTLA